MNQNEMNEKMNQDPIQVKKIVNLTPHPVRLFVCGEEILIKPNAQSARLVENREEAGYLDYYGMLIPIYEKSFGEVENLPEPEEGTIYVVSLPVAQVLAGRRRDVYSPDEYIRDDQGNIVGCLALARFGEVK